MALKHACGLDPGIDTRRFVELSQLVGRASCRPVPEWKAVVGERVFAHESGLHADGVLKHPGNYEGFDPASEGTREALCTLGNGYFSTRGAVTWARADGIHYPGTYLAGGYNRLRTDIAGRTVENEDLVNLPNWLALEFRIADGDWFDLRRVTILSYRQELDLRLGMLVRAVRFDDGQGRRSTLKERRLVSMSDIHLGALELALTAENWSARVVGGPGVRLRDRALADLSQRHRAGVRDGSVAAAQGRDRRPAASLPDAGRLSGCTGGANASVPRRCPLERPASGH